MLRISVAILATLAVAGPAMARSPAPPLRMTCHELLQGQPSRDATVYQLIGDTLYRDGPTGRLAISREGRRIALGMARDRGVVTRSYASHVRRGTTVRRTVFWQVGRGAVRPRFTETFDFARQRVTGLGGPEDSCHHDAYSRRR